MQFIRGRYWFIIFAVLSIAVVGYFFSDIVAYVLIAWVITLVTEPITKFFLVKLNFRKRKWGPSLSALLTMLIIVIVFLLLILPGPVVIQQKIDENGHLNGSKTGNFIINVTISGQNIEQPHIDQHPAAAHEGEFEDTEVEDVTFYISKNCFHENFFLLFTACFPMPPSGETN